MRTKTKQTEDFLHQTRSNYNRQSGEKTLVLVGVMILIVVVLSIVTILII